MPESINSCVTVTIPPLTYACRSQLLPLQSFLAETATVIRPTQARPRSFNRILVVSVLACELLSPFPDRGAGSYAANPKNPATDDSAKDVEADRTLALQARRTLKKYCYECHSGGENESGA